ncbi:MAG TPA: PfkB family carbohydrate kinase [Elusimicrobiales bacterium]|nr:PfkB family carbohydrate kinase [Elusimicrobiales bacterium]
MAAENKPSNSKIKTLAELAGIAAALRKKGKKTVLCHGVYDLLHPGHIKHLEAAKKEGDVLLVTLTPDEYVGKGPGRPVFNQFLRCEALAALGVVDYVAVNQWRTAVETIKTLKPDVYAKGSDYAAPEKDVTGGIEREREAVESAGGRMHFTDEITFSSTELLNKFFNVFSGETKTFIEDFRKQYCLSSVLDAVKSLQDLKVLVIGDAIVDEYHYCRGLSKPPKDNIVCAQFLGEERFAGGSLACANHAAGFCKEVRLLTCLGAADAKQEFVDEHLKPNVRREFFIRPDSCTVVKRRFVDPVFLHKLFEVAFFDDHEIPAALEKKICARLEKIVPAYDMVLVSDFGHGFITRRMIDIICKKARFLAVNTQTNSANAGYNLITKYPRVDYVCIDEPEMRLAAQSRYGELKDIIKTMARRLRAGRIAVTRGHKGSITFDSKTGFHEIPTFTDKVVDRVGAGDAFLSVTAPLMAAGAPAKLAGFVGNAVAGIKVGIVCNRSSVEPVPLYKFLTTLLK